MENSIALKKCKDWYNMLSPLAKVEFLEYLWKIDRHKVDYASMPDSLRKFHEPGPRPTHQEEE